MYDLIGLFVLKPGKTNRYRYSTLHEENKQIDVSCIRLFAYHVIYYLLTQFCARIFKNHLFYNSLKMPTTCNQYIRISNTRVEHTFINSMYLLIFEFSISKVVITCYIMLYAFLKKYFKNLAAYIKHFLTILTAYFNNFQCNKSRYLVITIANCLNVVLILY